MGMFTNSLDKIRRQIAVKGLKWLPCPPPQQHSRVDRANCTLCGKPLIMGVCETGCGLVAE